MVGAGKTHVDGFGSNSDFLERLGKYKMVYTALRSTMTQATSKAMEKDIAGKRKCI